MPYKCLAMPCSTDRHPEQLLLQAVHTVVTNSHLTHFHTTGYVGVVVNVLYRFNFYVYSVKYLLSYEKNLNLSHATKYYYFI